MHWRAHASLAFALGVSACVGPNPLLELGDDTEESGTGDGDGDIGDGDGDLGDGDGDGDGDTRDGDGDGDGDGCANGIQDGDETDVDCGGSCRACASEQSCVQASDCASRVCVEGVCAAPTCSDGVRNQDELETDCGGGCRMCEHSPFVAQLSGPSQGLVAGSATAMFSELGFAIAYLDFGYGAYVRWFDEAAAALGPAVLATPAISDTSFDTLSLRAGLPRDDQLVYLAANGIDPDSSSTDCFALALDPDAALGYQPIYQGPASVQRAEIDVDGDRGAFVWANEGEIRLRHHDYALGVDVGIPVTANPEFALRPGDYPTVATRDGLSVVAWSACDAVNSKICDIELRRHDGGWVDNAPMVLGLPPSRYYTTRVAIADDGRVALATWHRDLDSNAHVYAAMFDAAGELEGTWLLQGDITLTFTPSPAVVALSDGSFAFAWSDPGDGRVHVRRYIGPDLPLVDDVGDEAPWPPAPEPNWVSLATQANRLVVSWTALLDGEYVVQGQVLSF